MQIPSVIPLALMLWLASGFALATEKTKNAAAPTASSPTKTAPQAPVAKLVDINSASRAELKTLPGIGDAEANRIIANRPYLTKSHLVAKKVLELGPYDALRGRIIAVQTTQPKPKT